MNKAIVILLLCLSCITNTQGQNIEDVISNYFFNLPVDSSLMYLSNEIDLKTALKVSKQNEYIAADNYKVLKVVHFENNPNIDYLGFKNELSLVERKLDSLELKELSLILNYRAENKKACEKQFKIFCKEFKSHFTVVQKDKQVQSFANQKVVSFSNEKGQIPVLKIILKETLMQIDNPKNSVFSLIIIYQTKI